VNRMSELLCELSKTQTTSDHWTLTIQTQRACCGRDPFGRELWDVEVEAIYLNGKHTGKSVFRATMRNRQNEHLQDVCFGADLAEGDVIQMKTSGELWCYLLILDNEIHQLGADFQEPVQRYLNGQLDIHRLCGHR
jgi:hypothetical protein